MLVMSKCEKRDQKEIHRAGEEKKVIRVVHAECLDRELRMVALSACYSLERSNSFDAYRSSLITPQAARLLSRLRPKQWALTVVEDWRSRFVGISNTHKDACRGANT